MSEDITTYNDKNDLKKLHKFNGKRFYYIGAYGADKRGRNRTIRVYIIAQTGEPVIIGKAEVSTAGYRGDFGAATAVICDIYNYRNDGYKIHRKDVKIFEIFNDF
jgi:hypothetical protein